MTFLNKSTLRRLKRLPKQPSTWEGDRRSLSPELIAGIDPSTQQSGDCIIWMDRSFPAVRAMDVIPGQSGMEATVRVLLQAIEHPNSGLPPARPKTILVRNRELQLFLRGVLQDLEIDVKHSPNLPLCDEVFEQVLTTTQTLASPLPPALKEAMLDCAEAILQDGPWDVLDETRILSVELNHSDVETLYVSTLGMAGIDAGLLMYRSADSLQQFRQQVLNSDSTEETLQDAFLAQDCFFLNFIPTEGYLEIPFSESEHLVPEFGCIHPLEGMRHALDEEEAAAVILVLTALHRFVKKHKTSLADPIFPTLTSRFRVSNPLNPEEKVSIRVSTQPKFAFELAKMTAESAAERQVVHYDLAPEKMAYSLGWMPESLLNTVRLKAKVFKKAVTAFELKGDKFPVFSIQTSRPQAQKMLDRIKTAGGAKALCWVSGEELHSQEKYDICLLETGDGKMHMLAEFDATEPNHIRARQEWDKRCSKSDGFCGLVIAMGLSGSKGASFSVRNVMALYEIPSTTAAAGE